MSKDTQQIKESLSMFAGKYGPAAIRPATVVAVNDDDTVNVEASGLVIEDVRLRSVVKPGGKVLLIPAIGSIVQIASIENSDEFIVIAVEEISKFILIIGTSKFDMDDAGFLVKKDNEDLLSIVSDLIDASVNAIYNTTNGPTTGMMPASTTVFNLIKTRFNNLLKSN